MNGDYLIWKLDKRFKEWVIMQLFAISMVLTESLATSTERVLIRDYTINM